MGHTFLSFVFDNVQVSIETRPEVGESFAPVASLFKQFELIYVVAKNPTWSACEPIIATKRSISIGLILLRPMPTTFCRLRAADQQACGSSGIIHLLSNSCTINTIRYANAADRAGRFDIRRLLNGLIDSDLYYLGRADTTLPFPEQRRQSLINQAAQKAGDAADFPEHIRTHLPTMPSPQPEPSESIR